MIRFPQTEREWLGLLLGLTGMTAILTLALAFLQPGTLRYDPFVIQDDARQFLSWMPRLRDPGLLRGDLIADYWHSASPPLYRAVFAAAAAVGLPPPLTARLLPAILLPLTAWAAWRAALRLDPRPAVAFVAAALVMALAVHEDSIFSSTPRAAALALVLLVIEGLLAERPVRTIVGILLLALTYPAPALTCLGMFALSRVRTAPLGLDLRPRALAPVAIAVVLAAAAILPFKGEVGRWRPVVTLAQAQALPAMALPSGRSSIVEANGRIGWICSPRMGFLPEYASCDRTEIGLDGAIDILAFLPLLVLARRGLRSRTPGDPRRIYALALAAALVLWAAASILAFRLHLPSRYSKHVLAPLELLAIGTLLGSGLLALRPGAVRKGATALLALLILASFATPAPKLVRPADRGGLARIAALPRDARIAGIADDLPAVPALTGRAVLATAEHAVPYELGYYRPLHDRLLDSVAAVRATDPAVLAAIVRRDRVTHLAVDPATLATGRLPDEVQAALPEVPAEAAGQPLLARAPAACRLYGGPALILFDARCVVGWAMERAS